MKNLLLSLLTLMLVTFGLQAQETVSDEELKKYAVAIDSINTMKASLLNEIKGMVESNDSMTNARYNELSKIMNDEAKLKEANATEAELKFMKEVAQYKTDGTAKITETFQLLAKEYVGASTFNRVKKAITEDEAIRTKYRVYMDELEKNTGSAN